MLIHLGLLYIGNVLGVKKTKETFFYVYIKFSIVLFSYLEYYLYL